MTSHSAFEQQYAALRNGCGVVGLADWSSVTLTGGDRQTFLNNFCTNDVKRLVPGECCEAFVTNVKGRVVGHGLVSCRADELVLLGAPHQAPRLIEHLDRYIIREDVQLRDTTAERKYLLLSGGALAPDSVIEGLTFVPWNLIGGGDAGVLEIPPHAFDRAVGQLFERAFVAVDWQAFTAARIESGTPLYGIDFDENNFPQEVNRDREAISFNKGCYLGQETVARIDALGHVNQKIVGLRFIGTEVPAAGTGLSVDGATVGKVTSAAYSPLLDSPLGLAMVRREANSPGSRLESPVGTCEVIQLPVKSAGA